MAWRVFGWVPRTQWVWSSNGWRRLPWMATPGGSFRWVAGRRGWGRRRGGGGQRRGGRGGRGDARRDRYRPELDVQPGALGRHRALARGVARLVRARPDDRERVEAGAGLERRGHVDGDGLARHHGTERRERAATVGQVGRGVGGVERAVAAGVEVGPLQARPGR